MQQPQGPHMPTIVIRDESTTGERFDSRALEFPTERITVRDLVRERVYQEVQDYNRNRATRCVFRGLVQPSESEIALNGARQEGFRLRAPRDLEWHAQFDLACEAIARNRVLVLVGDRQATSLDEEVVLTRGVEVTFLKLVPLVGG